MTGLTLTWYVYAVSLLSFALGMIMIMIMTTQYTFGCPRVGNQALAEYITAQGTLYRVTHTNDIVPKLPPRELGFSHPGPEYWITSGDGDPVGTGDIKVFQGTDSTGGNADAKGDSVLAHQFYFEAITICL